MNEIRIGPNTCHDCGGDYGEHREGCRVKARRDQQEAERLAGKFPPCDQYHFEEWATEVQRRIVALEAGIGKRRSPASDIAPLLSAEINALPERVRRFIHDLETNCDPSSNVREIAALKENIAALEARLPKPLTCNGLEVRVGQHYERVAWYVVRDDGRFLDWQGRWTGEAEYWDTEEAALKMAEKVCAVAPPSEGE